MASVNKVILVGNLGRDPEMRSFPSGDQICNVTLATTDKWKDKQSGEMREHTEWHRLVFNGRLAEIAGQYLRKGSQIYVEGSIRTRKYQDKDGVEKYATDIRVDQMQMLGRRDGQGEPGGSYGQQGDYGAARGTPRQAASHDATSYDQNSYGSARGAAPRQAPAPRSTTPDAGGFDGMDDDIPF